MSSQPGLTVGVDIGGTFVDCVVIDPNGHIVAEKAPATPAAPTRGALAALELAAETLGLNLTGMLRQTDRFVYGTTVGLNMLVSRSGKRTGLLTTRGHEDAILIGRVHQKVAGLSPEEMIRAAQLCKPAPLVPRWLIRGIHERVDFAGEEVVALDEQGVTSAARELVEAGCETVAVSYLWAFKNPVHERRTRAIIHSLWPELSLSLSSEVAPVIGEYERTAATVVNAYLGPGFGSHARELAAELRQRGFAGTPHAMLASGGFEPIGLAADHPLETLGSGPAGGVVASQRLGVRLHVQDLVATDVGGTSFDVGMVVDGQPRLARTPIVERLHLALPTVDVRSIGAGGGSVAWLDGLGQLRVGPRSVGADPGPACYGRGGTEPTVTDADLVLGRLKPDALLGGRLPIDRAAAERALSALASQLGLDLISTASGIVRIVDAQMADLVRKVLLEGGYDPRRFAIVAYGGAAPLHVGGFAPDVGTAEVLVPLHAPVFSALGLALVDYQRVYERSDPMRLPNSGARLQTIFAELECAARDDAARAAPGDDVSLTRSVALRFRRQTHEVLVPVPEAAIDDAAVVALSERFAAEYERVFGRGTAYRPAGIEASTFRVVARLVRTRIEPDGELSAGPDSASARVRQRAVYFHDWVDETPVYAAERLRPGNHVNGPAVIDSRTTTFVIHPGQSVQVDRDGTLRMRLALSAWSTT